MKDGKMDRLTKTIGEQISKANALWQLFSPHERVLVAVSGGKDSLSLLPLLKEYDLRIYGAHVADFLSPFFAAETFAHAYCEDFTVIREDIFDNLGKNPCFGCSRRRRKLLLEHAQKLGITKLVFAHHKDDVALTLLLNIIFGREISTMMPKQPLFGGAFYIVRPLYFVPERLMQLYAKKYELPITSTGCPYEEQSRRTMLKRELQRLQNAHPHTDLTDNVFSSLRHLNFDFLPKFNEQTEKACQTDFF